MDKVLDDRLAKGGRERGEALSAAAVPDHL